MLKKIFIQLVVALSLFSLAGCSTKNTKDPLESFNRKSYAFNNALDKAILRPAASVYDAIVPPPLDKGIDNVLSNLSDVNTLLNDILQFKIKQASSDFGRILVNSTIGLGGLFDVAKHINLPKHNEDFGQTLATWGVGSGPYIMVPFLGPKTLRSLGGSPVDLAVSNVVSHAVGIDSDKEEQIYKTLIIINRRQGLLPLDKALKESGLDPYIAIRENYLAQRQKMIHGLTKKTNIEEEYGDTSFMEDESFNEDEEF